MLRFDIDFSGDKLSKTLGQRMKDQIAAKLHSANLSGRIKVTYTENDYGVPVDFHLEGSSEDVARAKDVLGWKTDSDPTRDP
jgi:hypothetical protein